MEISIRICAVGLIILWIGQKSFGSASDGLLANGDFETSPEPSVLNGTVIIGDTSLPGWKIKGTVEYINEGQKQDSMILVVPQGTHAARLGNDAQISQEIELDKGSVYSFTFSSSRTCAQMEALNVSVPPATGNVDLQTLYSSQGWDAYAWAFQAESDKGEAIFLNPGLEEDPTCGPVLDAIALKKLSTPDPPKDDYVVNGDFEEGPWLFQNATSGVLLPPSAINEGAYPLPGWRVESNKAVRYIDSNHFSVPQGKRAIQLISGKEGSISQTIPTVAGNTYILTFLFGDAGDSCHKPMALMAFAGDRSQNVTYSSIISSSYQPFNMTFKANSDNTRIAFYSLYYNTLTVDNSSLCGPLIDQVSVSDLSNLALSQLSSALACSVNLLALLFTLFILIEY